MPANLTELNLMLHIIYRSYGGENVKGRPDYYDKTLALMSFIRSFQQLKAGAAEIIFLNDGPLPPDRLRLMEQWDEVLPRSNMGLRGSWESTLEIPVSRSWPHNDLVWLAEDDYLYLPRALNDLIAAAAAHPEASYFGLYAMVGSRLPNGGSSDDRVPSEDRWPQVDTTMVHGHPWRGAISTTATFGARVGALVADRSMMRWAIRAGGAWDHTLCLMYQGLAPYPIAALNAWLRDPAATKRLPHRAAICMARLCLNAYQAARSINRSNRRLLVASDPALITYLETDYLARGTDWRSVATSTRQWMNGSLDG
jgi:hypothetical protein